ncbi:MAG: lyase family protein, partial [Bryobacteraceae bacterium]
MDAERIASIGQHDVIAFTTCVAEMMSSAGAAEHSRWFHYGLTSNDVVDTVQALQLRDCSEILDKGLATLCTSLQEKAYEYKDTIQIGRTHGIHAEPYSFGLKFALWFDEARRGRARFLEAAEAIRVGKISGAVGTFAHIGPEAEELICSKLGLRPA